MKSKFVELDARITEKIKSKERMMRTLHSVLQTSDKKKDFQNILRSAKRKHDQMTKEQAQASKSSTSKTYDRYGEVREDTFWKDRLKGSAPMEFQIDTRGTFAGSTTNTSKPSSSSSSSARKSLEKPSTSSQTSQTSAPFDPKKDPLPIIIVGPGVSDSINMYNAKDFLQDGSFISGIEKKNQTDYKPTELLIKRKKNGADVFYKVVDSATKFGPTEWGRVVAVFAGGTAWQFKGWKWSDPVVLFTNVSGFHVKYENEPLPETVKSWNVKMLTISKQQTKAHLAATASTQFWDTVDKFLEVKKKGTFHRVFY